MSRRRMWLGNLDHDISTEDLAIILSGNGEIVWLTIERGKFGTEADVIFRDNGGGKNTLAWDGSNVLGWGMRVASWVDRPHNSKFPRRGGRTYGLL